MITPRFKLTQDMNFLIINIRAPHCNLGEIDIDIDGNKFIFICRPYYLRLNLPGEIVENEELKSSFDSDTGEFSFTCPKKFRGEFFADLELITKLLTPKVSAVQTDGSIGSQPIEVIVHGADPEVQQQEPVKESYLEYGFGFAFRGRTQDFRHEFDDIFEIYPLKVSLTERHKRKMQYEQGKFNTDHYLSDFFESSEISDIISQSCPFEDAKNNPNLILNDKDFDFLKDLPNIQYDLCSESINYCHNGLLDILFAYCYDQRVNNFETNIESGWNITKLASTLCWFDGFQSPKDAIVSAFRRSLIYPLYRNFDLSQKVFEDLKTIIGMQEKYIIKVLIKIYDIFCQQGTNRYVLNTLFIKDYIIYVMKWDTDLWKSTVIKVFELNITKGDLGLNLTEVEKMYSIQQWMESIKLEDRDIDSDDYSTLDESSEDSSSSEYTTASDSDEGIEASNVTSTSK